MNAVHRHLLLLALLLWLGPAAARGQTEAQGAEDEKLLKSAGVTADGPGLLEFFRKHTPTADTAQRVEALLKQLGDKTFKVREKASADLIALGPPALPALRQATKAGELETQRRALHCLQAIEKRNAHETVAAAARLLKALRPEGACAALLKYLPAAADEAAEEILEALYDLSGQRGHVDAAVAEALRDPAPARRAAAALVLGRLGTLDQTRAVRRLLDDANLTIRFRAAQGLLCGGDRDAVPVLVGLLDKAPLPLAMQAEDLLTWVAGEDAPKVSLGESAEQRTKARQAWETWWDVHKDELKLAKRKLQSPFTESGAQARAVARRFLDALMRGDTETVRKTLEAPFVIDPFMILNTRAEVDQLFLQAAKAAKEEKSTYRITKTLRLEEYNRLAKRPGGMKQEVLKSLSRPGEIRAVVVEAQQRGRNDTAAILVRIRGARASVVGLGVLDPAGAKKK
jgi:hypothetical protein